MGDFQVAAQHASKSSQEAAQAPASATRWRWFWLPILAWGASHCGAGGAQDPTDGGVHGPDLDAFSPTFDAGTGGYDWDLPPGFPVPAVPEDNPMSAAKVTLGRFLFYDARLSSNGESSCATCHQQALAFTDGRAQALGTTGEQHPRGSMGLFNVAYAPTLSWANPLQLSLEQQANLPLFGDSPIELGLTSLDDMAMRLRAEPRYAALFAAAFPDDTDPISAENANRALASFERTLISGRSPFDRYFYDGETAALSAAAKRGYALFNGHPFECFHCHSGFNFTDHVYWQGKAVFEAPYHNTGLYNLDGQGAFPTPNTGIHDVTGVANDMGLFKAPSLRNIALTAPYMHDGSLATLSEVIDHYAAGGRTITDGPYAGVGSANPYKSDLLPGFPISEQERADLIAFLESLTDEAFITDPRFQDPWPAGTVSTP